MSLSARSARWSGWRRSRSTSSARPTTMPACGPPSSLSPEKQTRSAPAASALARLGSSSRARARPSRGRRRAAGRGGARPPRARRVGGCSAKPTTRKFDWWTRSRTAVSGPIAALVVGGARAVRGADLDQPGARAGEHLGNPEAVADLDQLAARDEHIAAFRERGQREQHGGGVVVDDERSLGAGQPAQDRREVVLA